MTKNELKKKVPHKLFLALKYNFFRIRKEKMRWKAENADIIQQSKTAKLFIFNTPWHKNLGDLAIAEAENAFIEKLLPPNENLVEIPTLMVNFAAVDVLKSIISSDATICVHGGGYLGTSWPTEEEVFHRIIKFFPNNKIVLFPQSIFYNDSPDGKRALQRSKSVYSKHSNLHLFARDKYSFKLMRQYYASTNIYLVPDIVLSGDGIDMNYTRNGVLLCMRSDKEKLLTADQVSQIKGCCEKYRQCAFTDTFAPENYNGPVNGSARKKLVMNKFEEFSKAELVVTDRLHGMVFAAITGTPCIAFSSHDHKVKGTYEWINGLDYICYLETPDTLEENIVRLLKQGVGHYNSNILHEKYADLEKLISANFT